MITETIYEECDLHIGVCEWCGEESGEVVYTDDGHEVCVYCIENEKFYQETMKGI